MDQIKKQLDDHNSGRKIFEDRRVLSLKNRLHSYKGQIYDASRDLSEEVCCVAPSAWLGFSLRACDFWLLPRYFPSFSNIYILSTHALLIIQKEIEEILGRGGEL